MGIVNNNSYKKMNSNKKGIFFTFAAIALSIVLILSVDVYQEKRVIDKTEVTKIRINTLNQFIKDINKDMERSVSIITTRTFIGMIQYIGDEDLYITDFNSTFEEGFLNGTIYGTVKTLLNDSTFSIWISNIQKQAKKIDIEANFNINSLSLYQINPWDVNVSVEIHMDIKDTRNTALWNTNKTISKLVSIVGLDDPIYLKENSGKVNNTIIITNVTPFVTGSDVTNFNIHINNSYYIASNYSPTYIMRLQGNLNSDLLGIESLVNEQDLIDASLPTSDRSNVDSIYYGNQSTTNYQINGTLSWFRLDDDHLEFYGVDGLTI